MIFYTAVGNRVEEDSGRFVVRVGEQKRYSLRWRP